MPLLHVFAFGPQLRLRLAVRPRRRSQVTAGGIVKPRQRAMLERKRVGRHPVRYRLETLGVGVHRVRLIPSAEPRYGEDRPVHDVAQLFVGGLIVDRGEHVQSEPLAAFGLVQAFLDTVSLGSSRRKSRDR